MKSPLVVGNWKMHGTLGEASTLAREVRKGLKAARGVEVVLAPPFTALVAVQKAIQHSPIRLAGQNLHWQEEGAFTGEVSPEMLRDSGCSFVIVGHSERRHLFNESDQIVGKKVAAALVARLRPILCAGETLGERRRGETTKVIARQLRLALKGLEKSDIEKVEFAYEPVWAIGTGHNATPEQIDHAHRWIRQLLKDLVGAKAAQKNRILYGGSVRPENAAELGRIAEVNGLLVGGASLGAKSFLGVIKHFASA